MSLVQLSVKLLDKPGQLSRVSDILGDEGINIKALAASIHGDDSQIHMIVDDPAKARSALANRGFDVHEHKVIAVETPDHPGGLNAILRPLKNAGINVTFLYPLIGRMNGNAILVVGASNLDGAEEALRRDYIRIIDFS